MRAWRETGHQLYGGVGGGPLATDSYIPLPQANTLSKNQTSAILRGFLFSPLLWAIMLKLTWLVLIQINLTMLMLVTM